MPYTEYGQLPRPLRAQHPHQSVRDELILEDGASFHSAGYDGTQGFAVFSDGTANFQGDVTLGGSLTLDSTGSIATASSGSRVELTHSASGTGYAAWYSGGARELLPAAIYTTYDGVNDAVSFFVRGAQDLDSMTTDDGYVRFNSGNHATQPGIVLDPIAHDVYQENGQFLHQNGSQASPSYAYESDPDTGAWLSASGVLAFGTGGTKRAEIRDRGLYTRIASNALPRVWYVDGGSHTLSAANTYESDATTLNKSLGTSAPFSANIFMTCYANNTSSATRREARCRVRWSTNGGSTWTDGPITRFVGLSTSHVSRAPLIAMGNIDNVTATGNVVIEMQLWGDHTEVSFTNVQLQVTVVGDL